jgi:hypothetical protein
MNVGSLRNLTRRLQVLRKILLMLVLLMSFPLHAASYPVADASFPPDQAESKQVRPEPSKRTVKPSPQAMKSDLIEKLLKLIRPWFDHSA